MMMLYIYIPSPKDALRCDFDQKIVWSHLTLLEHTSSFRLSLNPATYMQITIQAIFVESGDFFEIMGFIKNS